MLMALDSGQQVAFMARHVGDEFDGVISGVTAYGFFVKLDNMGVEGLVRVSTIDDDYYRFDEKQYRITGRRTGRSFRLGDRVRVGILRVDTTANEIDLFVARTQPRRSGTGAERKQKNPRRKRKSKNRGTG